MTTLSVVTFHFKPSDESKQDYLAYKAQYLGNLGGFEDLVVDEGGKKVYLLDGSNIFQVDLK